MMQYLNIYLSTTLSSLYQQIYPTVITQSRLPLTNAFGGLYKSNRLFIKTSAKCFRRFPVSYTLPAKDCLFRSLNQIDLVLAFYVLFDFSQNI
jgi:hypothetical protein